MYSLPKHLEAIAWRGDLDESTAGFLLISKIYRQMYANTGIATDSARVNRSVQWARLMAIPCRRLFAGRPMPDLQMPALQARESSYQVLAIIGGERTR